jgi:hypothetical protein
MAAPIPVKKLVPSSLCNKKMGQGKPTAPISANVNGLSAFRYPLPRLLALRERRKAESR